MHFNRLLIALALAATGVAAQAQAPADATCILAGRLSDDGRWAPRFEGVQLLGESGQPIATRGKPALDQVRQARLAEPALLSACGGGQPLHRADGEPDQPKAAVPALSAGLVEVEAVALPPLRTGGTLVELRVRVPGDRVVMLTR